jgi:hypothetical protein
MEELRERVERPAGTLGGLCQRVATLVFSTHHDRAGRGTIRRMLRSVPTSSSALGRTWRSSYSIPRSRLRICSRILPSAMFGSPDNSIPSSPAQEPWGQTPSRRAVLGVRPRLDALSINVASWGLTPWGLTPGDRR